MVIWCRARGSETYNPSVCKNLRVVHIAEFLVQLTPKGPWILNAPPYFVLMSKWKFQPFRSYNWSWFPTTKVSFSRYGQVRKNGSPLNHDSLGGPEMLDKELDLKYGCNNLKKQYKTSDVRSACMIPFNIVFVRKCKCKNKLPINTGIFIYHDGGVGRREFRHDTISLDKRLSVKRTDFRNFRWKQ